MKNKKHNQGIKLMAIVPVLILLIIASFKVFNTGPNSEFKHPEKFIKNIERHLTKNDAKTDIPKSNEAEPKTSTKPSSNLVSDRMPADLQTWDPAKAPNMYYVYGKSSFPCEIETDDVFYQKDDTGYTQFVYAKIGPKLMKKARSKRADISDEYPRGWPEKNQVITVQFPTGVNYKGWFWNRSHMLAHSLGGDDNVRNLTTGTRAQNVGDNKYGGGMQYTENLARQFMKFHKNAYILYSVENLYKNNSDIIPYASEVNIKSSDGSIDEKVFVYNVMPGYEIDYSSNGLFWPVQ
ncbi:DNA/RNA non-specific endonuclease [Mogibacterium diversum]|uniref:DNA/RNA non-specific endonuclease n=1 Tax=Mogibacterium diversum TaxID=114527 RepID=UPI0028D0C307|nr:DNA/RNA non-specific endonuclease [Mogibacterium diversum]